MTVEKYLKQQGRKLLLASYLSTSCRLRVQLTGIGTSRTWIAGSKHDKEIGRAHV